MSQALWESTKINSDQITESNTAVIVKITLGASPGSARSPNRITLQMAGYKKLVGLDEADCFKKIQAYVQDTRRPIENRSAVRDDRMVLTSKPTDMSLKYNKPCHLVIHLDDNLDWYFARDFRPFSRQSGNKFNPVFQHAQLIDSDGKLHQSPTERCRFATMIFNPGELGQQAQEGGRTNFVARFNINVELMDGHNGNGAYIPVIFDPDVRWPGGDGP